MTSQQQLILKEISKLITDFRKYEECFGLAASFCTPPWSQAVGNVSGVFTHARLTLEDVEQELEKNFRDINIFSNKEDNAM